jgi:hypothetical protein
MDGLQLSQRLLLLLKEQLFEQSDDGTNASRHLDHLIYLAYFGGV